MRYRVEYLPEAREDLIQIVRYIGGTLQNPAAAERFVQAAMAADRQIGDFPYANPVYHPIRPLKREYRKITVQHYLLFYWVEEEEKRCTVARVIYGGRNLQGMLK